MKCTHREGTSTGVKGLMSAARSVSYWGAAEVDWSLPAGVDNTRSAQCMSNQL